MKYPTCCVNDTEPLFPSMEILLDLKPDIGLATKNQIGTSPVFLIFSMGQEAHRCREECLKN